MQKPRNSNYTNVQNSDMVTITREEYNDLLKCKFAVGVIGSSLTFYGVDDRAAVPVLNLLGFTCPENTDAE